MISINSASHHTGLMDVISPKGDDIFLNRMNKSDGLETLEEICKKCDPTIMCRIEDLLRSPKN